MEKKFRNPTLLIAVAMLMLVTGGFLAVLQVGMDARRSAGIRHGFSFRGGGEAPPGKSSYLDDLERGSDIIKAKTSGLFADIFGGGSQPAPGRENYASAGGGRYRGYSADEIAGKYAPGDDAFEKYYQENYGSGGSSYSPSSSYGGDPGTFYGGGGGGGGSSQDVQRGGSEASGGQAGAPDEDAGGGAAAGAALPGEKTAGLAGDAAAPKLYASLPAKGAAKAAPALSGPGGGGSGAGDYSGPSFSGGPAPDKGSGKAGGLDAFKGSGAAKNLDGGLEGERTGGAASYGSQMSKNAGGVAAGGSGGGGGGGSVPAASKAENAASSGGGPSASSPASSSGGTPASSDNSGDGSEDTYYGAAVTPRNRASDYNLLKSVVTERLNGAEDKYVTPEEAGEGVDKALLAAGASPQDTLAKGAGETKPPPDPDSFSALNANRREELKKEVHVLLKRVETDYGAMKDIQFHSCAAYPEICKTHGITENFLTMTTGNGATITLGVKYVRKRWRTYTLDFKDPSGAQPAPSGKPGAISTGVYGDDGSEDGEGDY